MTEAIMNPEPFWHSRWVLWGFLAVAAFFLWTEHRAHVMGILPYLLFLACPLMHLFHHHGHRHHYGGEADHER
jgi:apolipoprotein N-acyltransferase